MRVVRYLVLASLAAAVMYGSSLSAAGKPRIFFIEPKNGATVKSPVHLEFGIENYTISAVPEGTVDDRSIKVSATSTSVWTRDA